MSEMNKNYQEREMILFKRAYDEDEYVGGCCWFKGLHLDKLDFLINLNYANPVKPKSYTRHSMRRS